MVEEIKDKAPVCEFKGYLRDDGKMIVTTDSEECRQAVVAAGKEMGIEVELEVPAVECEPCKEAAKRFLAAIQAKKAAAEPVPEPVTES